MVVLLSLSGQKAELRIDATTDHKFIRWIVYTSVLGFVNE